MSATSLSAANQFDAPGVRHDMVSARALPSWLLSLMLHFALVISGALLFRAGSLTDAGESIGDRGGDIVLYTGERSNEKTYLTEEDLSGSDGADDASPAVVENSATASVEPAPELPGAGLPKMVTGAGAAQASTSAASATSGTRRLGPTGGRSGGAATSIFGAIGEGQRFMYVFDRSSSMAGDPIKAAKRELLVSLTHLGDVHQFGIIFYNKNQTMFGPTGGTGARLYFAKKENRILAERFVSNTPAAGSTDHLPALKLALEARPDVIFFLTDADDPVLTAAELQKIRSWNVGSTINAIQFGYGPKQSIDSFLEQLTSENGGAYRYVDVTQLPKGK
jgi:hypothetical protein